MSMSRTVIQVERISKAYRIGAKEEKSDTLAGAIKSVLMTPFRNFKDIKNLKSFNRQEETIFWALRDINFEVKEGEVLGIIGHNGAGKSTLLKILSRITEPTEGRITIHGRVSSLLEVGTGFHPDLTGRENIYMNGTILGMTKREIDRKIDEIIDFSGVSQHIDTPVKRYSSGMTVRLAFSVAAHLDPEILIIDEVLAVGDAEFQKKCLGKMESVSRNQGKTVLIVSHNLSTIKQLCSSAVLLSKGRSTAWGLPSVVISSYINTNESQKDIVRLDEFILSEIKVTPKSLESGNSLTISARIQLLDNHKLKSFVWILYSELGERLAIIDLRTQLSEINLNGDSTICVAFVCRFVEGDYKLGFYYESTTNFGDVEDVARFSVMEYSSNDFSNYDPSVRGYYSLETNTSIVKNEK